MKGAIGIRFQLPFFFTLSSSSLKQRLLREVLHRVSLGKAQAAFAKRRLRQRKKMRYRSDGSDL